MSQKWISLFELKPGRWVFVPTPLAKELGNEIKKEVANQWKPPSFYFHLRKGGHVEALKSHSKNQFFYRADIEDFFGRVNRSRVTRCLKTWFPYDKARYMASESVARRPKEANFVLPYGFVQSPILASLALDKSKLGRLLRSLHGMPGFRVSVYVDDIIVSSNDAAALENVATDLRQEAEKSRFSFNLEKVEGPSKVVTAFNIELRHKVLKVTKERFSEFRKAYRAAESEMVRAGIADYVRSVNQAQPAGL